MGLSLTLKQVVLGFRGSYGKAAFVTILGDLLMRNTVLSYLLLPLFASVSLYLSAAPETMENPQ